MEFTPPIKFGYCGDEESARKLRKLGLSYLNGLVTDCSFNSIKQARRRIEVVPGLSIEVGINYGTQSVIINTTKEAAEVLLGPPKLPGNDLVITSVTEKVIAVDPTYRNGSQYYQWEIEWKGGYPPYFLFADSGTGDPVMINLDTTMVIYEQDDERKFTVKRLRDTDPWGAVDHPGILTQEYCGVYIQDSNGTVILGKFSGFQTDLLTVGHYGPEAKDNFPIEFKIKAVNDFAWDGGVSDFEVTFDGVVKSTQNIQVVYDAAKRKRNGLLQKTSGTYWCALDADNTETGISVKVVDSIGNVTKLPLSEITGDRPHYLTPTTISASGTTAHFKYGLKDYTAEYYGDVRNGTVGSITGGYDDFSVSVAASGSGIWTFVPDAGLRLTDGIGNVLDIPFTSLFGPPQKLQIVDAYNYGARHSYLSWRGKISNLIVAVYAPGGTNVFYSIVNSSGVNVTADTNTSTPTNSTELILWDNNAGSWSVSQSGGYVLIANTVTGDQAVKYFDGSFGPPIVQNQPTSFSTSNTSNTVVRNEYNNTYIGLGPPSQNIYNWAGNTVGYTGYSTKVISGRTVKYIVQPLTIVYRSDSTFFPGQSHSASVVHAGGDSLSVANTAAGTAFSESQFYPYATGVWQFNEGMVYMCTGFYVRIYSIST